MSLIWSPMVRSNTLSHAKASSLFAAIRGGCAALLRAVCDHVPAGEHHKLAGDSVRGLVWRIRELRRGACHAILRTRPRAH